jgi:hypothetical protein
MPGKRLSFGQMANHVATRRGDVPILRLALGVVLVVFFVVAILLQVQTSEAFILNGPTVGLSPDWHVVSQPFVLFGGVSGPNAANQVKAAMWGWGIEIVYLVCVIGEVAVHKYQGWFKTGAFVLVCFNFWTDFNYGSLPSGMGGQIAFAAITSFMVAFFGVIGLNMIFSAILDMTADC